MRLQPTYGFALSAALPAALLVGCEQQAPVDPEAQSRAAAAQTAAVMRSTAQALRANESVESAVDDTGTGLGVLLRTLNRVPTQPTAANSVRRDQAPPPPAPKTDEAGWQRMSRRFGLQSLARLVAPAPAPAVTVRAGVTLVPATADESLAAELEGAAADAEKAIKERLLAPGNLETKNDQQAIYLLKPDPTCRDLETNELDPECADDLTKLPVRVRLTRDGDGSRLDLLFGPDRLQPASIFVGPGSLAAELYLAGLKQTAQLSARTFGEEDETPDVMKGTARVELTRAGEKKVSFSLSILEMLDLQETAAEDPFVLRSAVAKPAFSLTADGEAKQITSAVSLGQTEVLFPWEPNGERTSTQIRVVIGGVTGSQVFTQGTKELKLTGLGLGQGPTYAEVRGQRIFQVDLNAMAGRAFDLAVTFPTGEGGLPRISLTPKLDLSIAWRLMAVAADFTQPPPAHLLDETYRIVAEGPGGAVLEPYELPGVMQEEGIKVVSGTVSLSSSKVSTVVTATAGQCLAESAVTAGEHPVLGGLEAKACR